LQVIPAPASVTGGCQREDAEAGEHAPGLWVDGLDDAARLATGQVAQAQHRPHSDQLNRRPMPGGPRLPWLAEACRATRPN